MLTATKTRKPNRTVTLGTTTSGKRILWITQDGKTRAYVLTKLLSKYGTTFTLGKADNGDGHMETYTVYFDSCGHASCDCAGHSFRKHCRHVDALLALIAAGKLAK